jgi:hypothetical protein
MVMKFCPRGPYPVLVLGGEHGSAKTETAKRFRSLVDPNAAPNRGEPREARDLMIAARKGWILAFDNLSYLPVWLSDGLCRLATGGGFATRELYSDDDEVIFAATRPVILNGIGEVVSRSDLLDRTILLTLPVIPERKRRDERDLERAFGQARPRILGTLLDAASCALRNRDTVRLSRKPRMADFSDLGFGRRAGTRLAGRSVHASLRPESRGRERTGPRSFRDYPAASRLPPKATGPVLGGDGK